VYAAIRQGKAKTGMAEELARRIKEGAIPIVSDVEGFMAYYVVYAPDDTVTAISIFNNYAAAEESNRRVARVDRAESDAPARRASHSDGWASDRAYLGIAHTKIEEIREETDAGSCYGYVRFTPKSGHSLPRPACPLCAKSGHSAVRRKTSHSITSSARARKVVGNVRPSASAVVTLTTRSNFVGCSTGISAGFSPRKILSTKSAARR